MEVPARATAAISSAHKEFSALSVKEKASMLKKVVTCASLIKEQCTYVLDGIKAFHSDIAAI